MKKTITTMIVLFSLVIGLGVNNSVAFATTEDAVKEEVDSAAHVITPVPSIVAQTGILIDAKTGTILYNNAIDEQKEPASTTKMITGLLAIEKLAMDRVVTIDKETAFTGGSRIYLMEEEKITVEELLYALFLESANDAAVALAKEMAGSVDDFAVMMNERAKELGAKNTNFVNPNGLHAEGHVSTSYDLAMIAKEAMKNPTFRKYVNTYKHTIQPTNKQEEPRYLYNTNRLLYDTRTKVCANGVLRTAKYDGVTGIKTGYTSEAGGCLVAGAERNGTELIAVALKSTDKGRFGDSIALLDWGFENYHTVKTIDKDTNLGKIKVNKGAENEVALVTATDGYATVPIDQTDENLTKVVKISENVDAPVDEGQVVGTVDFFQGDICLSSVNVVAKKNVELGGALAVFGVSNKSAVKIYSGVGIFIGLAGVAIATLLFIRYKNIKRRKQRRAERAMRIAMERERDKLYFNKEKYINR